MKRNLANRLNEVERRIRSRPDVETMSDREAALRIIMVLMEAKHRPTPDNLQAAARIMSVLKEAKRQLEQQEIAA